MKNSTGVTGFLLIFLAFLVLGNVLIARETLSSDFPRTSATDNDVLSGANDQRDNSNSAPDVKAEYAPDELIVKFKSTVQQDMSAAILTNSVTESSLSELNKKHRVKKATPLFRKRLGKTTSDAVKSFQAMIEKARSARGVPGGGKITDLSNIYVLRVEEGVDILLAVKEYTGDQNVEYAEPNYKVQALITPDDPLFSNLWGLHNTGQSGGTADADIDAPEAWDIETGSSAVVVAVIDTGVDYNHEDLAANMWTNTGEADCTDGIDDDGNGYIDDCRGWDFANNDNDPYDDNGHGTHCSGTIAAVGDNGIGVAGVNWNLRIMPLKFLTSDGGGYTDDAIAAILYAANMGTMVMSNSWGGGGYSQSLKDAIQAANDAGILFIAAAGNSSSDNDNNPNYPSNYDVPNVIAVAATDHNDDLASFSSYGATTVDLGAPGVDVYSTIPGNSYGYKSGTSMATPHVAGVAGLVISQNQSLSALEVKGRVLLSVDPLTSLDGITLTGGRLNALKALTGPYNPPIAEFSSDYTYGPTPVTIQFTNLSIYAGTPAWHWDFGDGTFSAERNPVHTYTDTGKYTVSLTVTDEYGSDTETRTEFIRVGMGWMIETVDGTGNTGMWPSLALDISDRPHISYYDYTSRALKYAYYDGATWQIQTVDSSGDVGYDISLALDSSDRPHISYSDKTSEDLKYAYYDGAAWQIETVDSEGRMGYYSSLALDSSGRPHISYHDHNYPNEKLKYAYYDGGSWQIETVDSEGCCKGLYTSLALDASGRPHISYQAGYPSFDLKYAYYDGVSWQIETVDGTRSEYTSLALDASDRPHISYYGSGNLKYAYYDGAAWQIETLDSPGDVGLSTSLALDASDRPHISYYGSGSLKYAYYDGAAWQIETVGRQGDMDLGLSTSLGLDASDRPHISYYDTTNGDLKYAYFTYYPLTADFSGDPTSGPNPLTVQFTDLSTSGEGIVSRDWDFGDGGTSTEQNPTHQYTLYGVYTVCLTVAEADGDTDKECKVDYITVEAPDISAAPPSKDFGSVIVGESSDFTAFTITNDGTLDLVIGGVYLTGPNPYQFRIRNDNCSGRTLAPSESCTIQAVYRPTKRGTMYAKIGIGSNDPDTPTLYIKLTGTGVKKHKKHEEH
ncbi:MAG TPA: PKD domain-containing protein [Nitrospirae bacterium]|nr:PKD domain-containing protein [Nitrospirota bacterium]HDZ01648.1 PKD domain-containing protein [Nitrospirota bacterium]